MEREDAMTKAIRWRRFGIVALALVVACGAPRLPPGAATGPGAGGPGKPSPWAEPAYVQWLEKQSMLYQADQLARTLGGSSQQWQHPFGTPQPAEAVRHASVWLL